MFRRALVAFDEKRCISDLASLLVKDRQTKPHESSRICYDRLTAQEDVMTKHVLDRQKCVTNELLQRTIAIERNRLPQRASLLLQRRQRSAGQRLQKFALIERRLHTQLR